MYDLRILDRRDEVDSQLLRIDERLTVVKCLYGSAGTIPMQVEARGIIGRLLVEQQKLEAGLL